MKRFFLPFLILAFISNFIYANPGQNVSEIRLENGLTLFTLEDYSSPLVHVEFITKAGISSQNENNAGFFTLYSRIFQSNLKSIPGFEVECNADSTRFAVTIPSSELKSTLDLLAQTAFSPNFTDEIIKTELSNLKNEVLENENSLPGFINAAIDSRVFSGAPWKHDSGIYPALFSRIDYSEARTTLNEISEKYYTPQNSAVFISGNIETEKVKNFMDLTFGIYYSSSGLPAERPVNNSNSTKKYVIHHPELSDEMTQIVMQYTNFAPDSCDLISTFLNNDYSSFKQKFLMDSKLGILGNEYINAAPARKKNTSRLIIQSLLQNVPKISEFEQSQRFYEITKNHLANIDENELEFAKANLSSNSNFVFENPNAFMYQLASYWTIREYDNYDPDDAPFSIYSNSPTTAAMMSRQGKINSLSLNSISACIENDEPYIFVIMNSKMYEKNKKEFEAAGFEVVSTANASWYSQELFKHIRQEALDRFNEQNNRQDAGTNSNNQNLFYENNKNTVSKISLSNNIPIYVKQSSNTTFTTIMLNISGGKLHSANNHGFEELMIGLLAANIQNEIYKKSYQNQLKGNVSVNSNVGLTSSEIILECNSADFEQCINAISNSILYTEAIPSIADRIVANLQYKKRLENGDATYQMFAQTISQFFGKKNLYSVFEAEKDILQKVDFDDILNTYSDFLNSSRYSFILTGAIPENFAETIENEVKKMKPGKAEEINLGTATFPVKTSIYVKINHTFLTDVPSSKAGKMPAKLIPTTEFIDPVIYIFKKPDNKKDLQLYSAIVAYIENKIPEVLTKNKLNIPYTAPNKTSANKNFIPKDCAITTPADSDLFTFQPLIFKNVAKAKEIENLYTNEILMLLRKFATIHDTKVLLQEIKDIWYMKQFADTNTNTGVALQIKNGIIQANNPEEYIDAANTIQEANAEDFINLIERYFIKPELIIYSNDAKK